MQPCQASILYEEDLFFLCFFSFSIFFLPLGLFFFSSSFFSNILLQMVNEKPGEKMRNRKKKESKKDREHRFPLCLSMSSNSDRNTCRNLRKNNSRSERKMTRKSPSNFHFSSSRRSQISLEFC